MHLEKIILGTVQFGLNYGINNKKGKIPKTEINKILNFANDNGINILDTAEAYADSQEKIGEYHKKSNNKFNVITKFSSNRTDLPENISERVKHNISTLNVDNIYCYMFHSFADFDSFYSLFRTELLNLKNNGFIQKIGVSLHSNEEINKILKYKDIDLIQMPYNMLDNKNKRELVILKAKKQGIKVYTRSVFLQGLFFKDINSLRGNLLNLKKYLEILKKLVINGKMNDLALSYVYSNPNTDGVLLGVDNVFQLKSNISCIKNNVLNKITTKIDSINVEEEDLLNPVNWVF